MDPNKCIVLIAHVNDKPDKFLITKERHRQSASGFVLESQDDTGHNTILKFRRSQPNIPASDAIKNNFQM